MDNRSKIAILIIGSTGKGKTFLINCMLGTNHFLHEVNPEAVTLNPESVPLTLRINNEVVNTTVWNLEGIVEPNANNFKKNCDSISKAISSSEKQIFVFMTKHRNSRLSFEEIMLFSQLMKVYNVQPTSTILLVNGYPNNSSDSHKWYFEFVDLMARTTGFNFELAGLLKYVKPENNKHDFLSENAQFNKAIIEKLVSVSSPILHVARGRIEMPIERMAYYRDLITRIENEIVESRRVHGERIGVISASIESINHESNERTVNYNNSMTRLDNNSREIKSVVAENEKNHQSIMDQIQAFVEESRRNTQKMLEAIRQAEEEGRKIDKDRKNLLKQGEKIIKAIIKKPLTIAPLIATIVIAPYAAPLIGSALGIGEIAASAVVGGVIGAGSSLINKQNVIVGITTGAISGGFGAFAEPMAAIPNAIVNASGAGINSVITNTSPIASIAGSLGGSVIGNVHGIEKLGDVGEKIVTSVSSNVVRQVIIDPKDVSNAVASGVIFGGISGAVKKSVDEVKLNSDVKEPELKKTELKVDKPKLDNKPKLDKPEINKGQEEPKQLPKPVEETQKLEPDTILYEPEKNTPKGTELRSNVTVSRSSLAVTSPDGLYVSTNNIGVVNKFNNEKNTVRHTVGFSNDIYLGGTVYTQSISTTTNTKDNAAYSARSKSQVLEENHGVCVSERVLQGQTVNLNGSITETVYNEKHFNTIGCGVPMVGAGVIITMSGGSLAPVVVGGSAAVLAN